MKKITNFLFGGRIARGRFILWVVAYNIVVILFSSVFYAVFLFISVSIFSIILPTYLFGLLIALPITPIIVKRFHDINWSGYFSLIFVLIYVAKFSMIPLFNILLLLLTLFLFFKQGTDGDNIYGKNTLKILKKNEQ